MKRSREGQRDKKTWYGRASRWCCSSSIAYEEGLAGRHTLARTKEGPSTAWRNQAISVSCVRAGLCHGSTRLWMGKTLNWPVTSLLHLLPVSPLSAVPVVVVRVFCGTARLASQERFAKSCRNQAFSPRLCWAWDTVCSRVRLCSRKCS